MSNPTTIATPRHVPGMETYREKASRKFKENPWVPLGSLATVGALVVAMVKMRRGQSHSFNHWLRVRVAAQGLTIVAIVAGTYSMRNKDVGASSDPTLTRNDVDVEQRRLEKVAREKDEFEERLRGAEEAHDLESELRKARRNGREPTNPGSASEARDTNTGSARSSGGWMGWLGWGRSSGSTDSSKQPPSTSPTDNSTTKS
ncbi:hypoxia induced protein conserved region-domain-containing protein [Lyophyllum atratum]|nr:hypoxia induced protein conserved region-domain-containing protein [Lyophyllum atratum]